MPTNHHQPSERVGRYEIAGRLALGGMAEILLGRLRGPSGFDRAVVIKRILPHLAEEQSFVNMFLDEARLAARLNHPNVVQVYELGEEANDLFLVMEYLEGESAFGLLRRVIAKKQPLEHSLLAFLVAEACSGLHAAHELVGPSGDPLNLVHRDVSPQNIFVTYNGAVKVLDFGIAKAADRITKTEAGQLKGKFEYMSPEQCRGKPIDRRSDIFALGTVLYEITTRRRLFKRESKLATLEAVLSKPIQSPRGIVKDYPPVLERIVMRALARDPTDRYATAAEMRRDLLAAMRELNAPVAPEESLSRVMKNLFADRVEVKNDMLARLRAGETIDSLPAPEADSSIEVPEAAQGATGPHSTSSARGLIASVHGLPQRRSKMGWFLATGALGALLVVAVFFLTGLGAPTPSRLERAGNLRFDIPKEPGTSPNQNVKVMIDSTPTGADVYLAKAKKGQTPLTLDLARGDEAVKVGLRLSGYADVAEEIVPSSDQRIRVVLSKASSTKKAKVYHRSLPSKKTKGSSTSSFRRFD